MSVERFFELFLEELKHSEQLRSYYKYLEDEQRFNFRKAYFIQRLHYIANHIFDAKDPSELDVFDCGCGYGTTDFFLAMNGVGTVGSTLEFYYDHLEPRYEYWSQFGEANLFEANYENLFDNPPRGQGFDRVIVQDTLHHLEPLPDALHLLKRALRPDGKMILIEENGSNIIQNLKLFKQRGFNRVVEMYDERLEKTILLGNENIRSVGTWEKAFAKAGMQLGDLEYVRYHLPGKAAKHSVDELIAQEQRIADQSLLKRKYRFFGINFTAQPNS